MKDVVAFILEVDKLKAVERQTRPLGLERRENSAEHSWQVALLASALAPRLDPALDVGRVVQMLLLHDLGEIDTGDAFFFADGHHAQKAAEQAALKRILSLLDPPSRVRLEALAAELDANITAEARFAHALDRAMPALLNLASGGGTWREHGVSHAQVVARVGPPVKAGCPALWDHLERELDAAAEAGWFSGPAVTASTR